MSLAIVIIRPLSALLTKRVWRGHEHIPPTGGVIVAANHLSWVDPFTLAHFVYKAGRLPRFMAKESLFNFPVSGWILRGAHQIPVRRGERDGADALRDAVTALKNGEAVLIYPEGTVTRDPDYWPMQAKTGVARLASMSGAPIIPVAQWGPQQILGRSRRLHLFPRKTIQVSAGEPLYPEPTTSGEPHGPEALRSVTQEVMLRIREQLETMRQEPAPAEVWDPRQEKRLSIEPIVDPGPPLSPSSPPPASPSGQETAEGAA